MSLLVVGSLALDDIETPFGNSMNTPGGSAAYISVAASYFDAPIRMVGVVGSDFPKSALDLFEERSIDTDGLQIIPDGRTFRWHGKYHYDMNVRDTIRTDLNVFEKFDPIIPDKYRKTPYVCLGNIDPVLQLKVLDQMEKPRLVLCDTMNFWIEGKPKELLETLKRVDILVVNESEARLLSHEPNLYKSAKILMKLGPKIIIIKKGEHGAILVTETTIFSAPAYPLDDIHDPTGAGDAFAGGFMGWLARTDDSSDENLKRAVIYGSVMASFSVSAFGTAGFDEMSLLKIRDRFNGFLEMSRFEEI